MVMKYEKRKSKQTISDDVKIEKGEQVLAAAAGPDGTFHLDQTIDPEPVLDAQRIAKEKFMHDMLTIQVADPVDENDARNAEVTVNGKYIKIPRGVIMDVPRTHVAVLAQAKGFRVVQDKVTNPDGSTGYRERVIFKVSYPFQVIHDPHPEGPAWLRQLLQNTA